MIIFIVAIFSIEQESKIKNHEKGNVSIKTTTFGLIIRVKGSPRVESIPRSFVYVASAEFRGNISTIVCCNFKSQST